MTNTPALINASTMRKVKKLLEDAHSEPPPMIYYRGEWWGLKLKVLFLDVDGVIITAGSKACRDARMKAPDPGCVAQLNRVLLETGAKVVVSSCWRIGRTRMNMQRKLRSWGVECEVVGLTPNIGLPGRGREIEAWLKDCIPEAFQIRPGEIAILDDCNDMAPYMDRLVRTDFRKGLTKAKADAAIRMLNGR